jgi:DNA polymerase-1
MCDYSGQESVILADFSKEPKLLDFYKNGEADMHSYVAKMLFPDVLGNLTLDEIKELHPNLRQAAKSTNFAIAYGGNGYTIAENSGLTPKEGEKVYEAFMKAFPELAAYFDRVHKTALKTGYVSINNVSKLKRYIFGFRDYKRRGMPDSYFENMVFKMALNTPCQGTGADMTKLAGYRFFNWIKQNKLLGKVLIVTQVHDEIVAECSPSMAEKVGEALQACMETAGDLFLTELHIKAEAKISTYWKK